MPSLLLIFIIFLCSCSNMLNDMSNMDGMENVLHGYFVISNNDIYIYKSRTLLNMNVNKAAKMRFRNEGEDWPAEWEIYASVKEWILPGRGQCIQNVYGQFQDIDGEEITASDSIILCERVTASDGKAMTGDRFGASVAVSGDGNTVVVGVPGDRNNYDNTSQDHYNQGAVYVYSWDNTDMEWNERILKTRGERDDNFGCSVAVSSNGSRIAAGAYNASPDITMPNWGAVYIFDKVPDWTQSAVIYDPAGAAGNAFGYSVSLSADGEKLAIGSPNASITGKVFVAGSAAWLTLEELTSAAITGLTDRIKFGNSVSIAGNGQYVAAGAPEWENVVHRAGIVIIFTDNISSWSDTTEYIADPDGDDYFGCSVALDYNGSFCAIGARGTRETYESQGSSFAYNRSGSSWDLFGSGAEPGHLYYSTGANLADYFGGSVCVSNDGLTLIFGADSFDQSGRGDQGAAFHYFDNGTDFIFKEILYAIDGASEDHFASSVAISGDGNTVAAGAIYDTGNINSQGSVYIFKKSGGTFMD
ncbi:MAG: FG-GAP repeat protein [Spirochaetota bacterium]